MNPVWPPPSPTDPLGRWLPAVVVAFVVLRSRPRHKSVRFSHRLAADVFGSMWFAACWWAGAVAFIGTAIGSTAQTGWRDSVARGAAAVGLSSVALGVLGVKFGLTAWVWSAVATFVAAGVTFWAFDKHPTAGCDPQRQFTAAQRAEMLARDGYRCRECGAEIGFDGAAQAHADHIVPWSRGGRTTVENGQMLCQGCNLSKSNRRLSYLAERRALRDSASA